MEARLLSHYQASSRLHQPSSVGPTGLRRSKGNEGLGLHRVHHPIYIRQPAAALISPYRSGLAHHAAACRTERIIQEQVDADGGYEAASSSRSGSSEHGGTQLAVLIQALSRQLALVLLIAMTCGLQAMALVMPPPAGSIEVASIVWDQGEVASQTEDRLLEVLKAVGARVDSAVGTFTNLSSFGRMEQSEEAQQVTLEGQELIREVWGVVADYYLDARGAGFDLESWTKLRDTYLSQPLSTHDSAYRAIREMLAYGLKDPYTRFITPSEFQAMRKYDVTGVGLNLATAEEFSRKSGMSLPEDRSNVEGGVWVLGMIKGGAADRAGIRQGDEILKVDGQEISSLSPFKVAGLLQGADGDGDSDSFVELEVRRRDASLEGVRIDRPKRTVPTPVEAFLEDRGDKKLSRELLYALARNHAAAVLDKDPRLMSSVLALLCPWLASAMLSSGAFDAATRKQFCFTVGSGGGALQVGKEGQVGHVHLTAFNARALTDVAAAVKSLESQGAAELVLDLRDNRGGLVQEGIEIAKLFLEDKAPIVVTQTGAARDERAVRAVGEPLTTRPLTILVNEHTASASEIFAGALRDNCRALLVGTKTYGKGLIQSVYELSDSSGLVLTVGKYLTPLRTDIDREGLKPDFRHMPSSSAAAEQLQACRLSHEA